MFIFGGLLSNSQQVLKMILLWKTTLKFLALSKWDIHHHHYHHHLKINCWPWTLHTDSINQENFHCSSHIIISLAFCSELFVSVVNQPSLTQPVHQWVRLCLYLIPAPPYISTLIRNICPWLHSNEHPVIHQIQAHWLYVQLFLWGGSKPCNDWGVCWSRSINRKICALELPSLLYNGWYLTPLRVN